MLLTYHFYSQMFQKHNKRAKAKSNQNSEHIDTKISTQTFIEIFKESKYEFCIFSIDLYIYCLYNVCVYAYHKCYTTLCTILFANFSCNTSLTLNVDWTQQYFLCKSKTFNEMIGYLIRKIYDLHLCDLCWRLRFLQQPKLWKSITKWT